MQNRNRPTDKGKKNRWLLKGKGINSEFGINVYRLLYVKWTYCVVQGTIHNIL